VRAGDPDNHLIEMPARVWLGSKQSQVASNLLSDFQHQPANCLVAYVTATLDQQILDIALAQCEPQI
jgi:hypothetical protein